MSHEQILERQTLNRQIVLDTETTGMNQEGPHFLGHRIIEIGAVELINRRPTGNNFHIYIKPDRLVDPEAFNVHGISDEFLFDKPTFAEVVDEFIEYIRGSELIIHNAPFDVGFIDYELKSIGKSLKTEQICQVTDSLSMARQRYPGKRNSLDALCTRLEIDNSKRSLHGALLDSEILADVFLKMTGGQTALDFLSEEDESSYRRLDIDGNPILLDNGLKIIYADESELLAHENRLDLVQKKGKQCLWRDLA